MRDANQVTYFLDCLDDIGYVIKKPTGVVFLVGWNKEKKSTAINIIDDLNKGVVNESQIKELLSYKHKLSECEKKSLELHFPAIHQMIFGNGFDCEDTNLIPYHCDYCPFSQPTEEREHTHCGLLAVSVLATYPKCTEEDWRTKFIDELKPIIDQAQYLDKKAREVMNKMVLDFYREAKDDETVGQFRERYLKEISSSIKDAISRITKKQFT